MSIRDLQFAREFNRAKQSSTPDSPPNPDHRQTQISLDEHKRLLLSAVRSNNKPLIGHEIQTLIHLRADLLAITLNELQETYGNVDERALKAHLKTYYHDCYTLTHAFRQYLPT